MTRFLCFFLLLIINLTHAQILIDDTNPSSNTTLNTSAILEVRSNDKALLLPRLTTNAINTLTPIEGMMVYDKSINCFKGYRNGAWIQMGGNCLPGGKFQNFDDLTGWTYTADPAAYNENNDDVWGIVNSLPSITTLGGNFWGMRDLENDFGGGAMEHTLTFETVDLTGISGAQFSFDYESSNLNKPEERFGYRLVYDTNPPIDVDICNGCNVDLEGTITVNIPDTVNMLKVVIYAKFDGANDIAAVDNIALTY